MPDNYIITLKTDEHRMPTDLEGGDILYCV